MLLLLAPMVRAEETHVTARIVSDASAIDRASSFRLGVELVPEPGWHVYWRNPGEAGLATEVVFELPAGFAADQLQWPVPVVFEQPGGLIGYGYKKPVVLAATVTSAAGGRALPTKPATTMIVTI